MSTSSAHPDDTGDIGVSRDHKRPRPASPAVVSHRQVVTTLAAGAGVIVGLLLLEDTGAITGPIATHLVVMAIAAGQLAHSLLRRPIDLARFASFAFVFVWWGVAPVLQISRDVYPLGLSYSQGTVNRASTITLVAVIALSLGLAVGERRAKRRSWDDRARREVGSLRARLMWLILAGAVVGVFVIGPTAFVLTRDLYAERIGSAVTNSSLQGLLRAYVRSAPLAVTLVLLDRRWRNGRRSHTGMLATSCFLLLLTANPISTARYWSGAVVLSIIFLAVVSGRIPRKTAVCALLAYVAALAFLFPYLDTYRRSDQTIDHRTPTELYTDSQEYDSYGSIAGAVLVERNEGLRLGRQTVLAPLTFAVPRSIWAGKPTDTATSAQELLGLRETRNLASALPGELYVDFTLIGVAAGMALLGFTTAAIRRLNGTPVTYVFLCGYLPILLRGSLLNAFASLIPPLLLLLILTRPRPSRSRSRLASVPLAHNAPIGRSGGRG